MLLFKILRHCITLLAAIFIISCSESAPVPEAAPEKRPENPNPVDTRVDNKEEDDKDKDPPAGDPNAPNPAPVKPVDTSRQDFSAGGQGGSGGGGGAGSGSTNDGGVPRIGANGICGNGIQEVLPGAHNTCIYDLYGTTTNGVDGPSSLYFFANDTGLGYSIGVITEGTVGVERVGAIDFNAQGILYGVGERSSDSQSVLITIDCVSAQATIIGLTGIQTLYGPDAVITDIDIDSQGHLFAFADSTTNPNVLGLINPLTGAFSAIGPAGLAIANSELGNGIASAPFAADSLYHAGQVNVSTLNETTGVATTVDGIDFFPPADSNPRISAMDHNNFFNITYIAINDGSAPEENYVAKIDLTTGTTSYLPQGPLLAPGSLDGIAVNQHYEECDQGGASPESIPPLPAGTDCTENCQLFESDCADGLDNDRDGNIDCLDSDCDNQSCDDDLACTNNDVCVSTTCAGTANPCIDENPCSVDGNCIEPSGLCDFTELEDRPNFGDCEVDGLACTLGKCLDGEGPFCFEQNMALIPTEENGCLDGNPCSADACVETPIFEDVGPVTFNFAPDEELNTEAQCVYSSLEGTLCQPGSDPCVQGVCTLTGLGTESSPYDVECLDPQPRPCDIGVEASSSVY